MEDQIKAAEDAPARDYGKGKPKPRILNSLRRECLACFEAGMGYKSTAKKLGLRIYTVREYLRRYKRGDMAWVERGRKG